CRGSTFAARSSTWREGSGGSTSNGAGRAGPWEGDPQQRPDRWQYPSRIIEVDWPIRSGLWVEHEPSAGGTPSKPFKVAVPDPPGPGQAGLPAREGQATLGSARRGRAEELRVRLARQP